MTAEKKTTVKKPAAHKPAAHKPVAGKKPAAKKPAVLKAKKTEKPVDAETDIAAAPVAQPTPVITKQIGSQNFYAVGKRKTAVAQIIISSGDGKITVNELPIEGYFGTPDLQGIVRQPLSAVGVDKSFAIRGKVHGGGIHAQAEAMRHAITRAIVAFDPESRRTLKKLGFLTRDPRVKERKKPGLKRARRAPQFSKR
ncbi:MAG: 30S ribosomal protein S9 [Candidatus Doudnabacteria bacterium]|nr:30S ribosomal protein S9 [Candidatus Doudnabacteria bacterium]